MGKICLFKDRCGTSTSACTEDVAIPSNCGFIAEVEKEKKQTRIALSNLLRMGNGIICFEARPYLEIKASAKHLIMDEFYEALLLVQEEFLASQKGEQNRTKEKSPYFV